MAYRSVKFQLSVTFSAVTRISKFHESSRCIITYFKYSIWGILLLEFIKSARHKSSYHLLVLVIFLDLNIMKFWSVNCMWQVCKLSSLNIFLYTVRVQLLAFVKYIYHSIIANLLENGFLVLFDWKPLFCDKKLFKIFLYLCIYFVQKIAELVLARLSLLGNGWSCRVVESHF